MKPACVMVPFGVVTETFPELPVFTMADMPLAESTVKVNAVVPPKLTVEADVKLLPMMVIFVPFTPVLGVKPVIEGPIWINPVKEADPKGVVTVKLPVAPLPTTATIVVGEATWKEAALVPPNKILVAPVKLVPVKVTAVPIGPPVGVNEVMVGGLRMVNGSKLVAPRVALLTEINPVVAPVGTTVVMLLALNTVNAAEVPLNLTEVTPVKLFPEMITTVPTAPEVGVKLIICG